MGGGALVPHPSPPPPPVELTLSSSNIGLFCYGFVLFCFVWGVEGHSAYFALRFVFKLYIFVDVVVILSVTYLTNSRVTSVLACIFPESMDVVLKALSSLSV